MEIEHILIIFVIAFAVGYLFIYLGRVMRDMKSIFHMEKSLRIDYGDRLKKMK